MRIAIGIFAVCCLWESAKAQTPAPEIPSRQGCEDMSRKSGAVDVRYGSTDTYLLCLVTGSVGTLQLEAKRLNDVAEANLTKITAETPHNVVLAGSRNARAMANLSLYTIKYLREFLYKIEDEVDRDLECQLAVSTMQISGALNELVDKNFERLETYHPAAFAQGLKDQEITHGSCTTKYGAYLEGNMIEPERNFLFPEPYMSTMMACAEREVDFYGLLDQEFFLNREFDDSMSKAIDAVSRINYHCHLPIDGP